MNISPELSASILADMVDYKGSSRYLAEQSMERTLQAALHHTVDTITQQMNFGSAALRACLATNTINDQRITHVVAGIEWGYSSVVAARITSDSMPDAELTKVQFQTGFITFVSAVEAIKNDPSFNRGESFQEQTLGRTEATIYSDIFEQDDGILLEGFHKAFESLQLMPFQIKHEAGGRSWPVAYNLLSVDMLSILL